jgi:FkbM family methyltransferase
MIHRVKKIISRIIFHLNCYEYVIGLIRNKKKSVFHKGVHFKFATPNYICKYRADTFSSKEPETLEWIDGFIDESVFWDIGANVGLYSIYAAKNKKSNVFSFEPSVFNLEILAKNINLNDQTHRINIVPIAISDKCGFGRLNMSTTEWGGALSTFDKPYGYDGTELITVFEYSICSVSLDDAIEKLNIPMPDYLKIDVDGIEHLVLEGGIKVLKNVKSVLIEISIRFDEQRNQARKYLEAAGLTIIRGNIEESTQDTVNQIWIRQ